MTIRRKNPRKTDFGVVRLGQTFSLGEVLHHLRILEAVDRGDLELAKRLVRDPLETNVRRKFLSMRERGREELAKACKPVPYTPTPEAVIDTLVAE